MPVHAQLALHAAEIGERVRRRKDELQSKGFEMSEQEVESNLLERDRIDSSRSDSPLRQAEDAIVLDNTHLNRQQQLQCALQLAQEKMTQHGSFARL